MTQKQKENKTFQEEEEQSAEIQVYAIAGILKPQTMKLIALLKRQHLSVLIDSGIPIISLIQGGRKCRLLYLL